MTSYVYANSLPDRFLLYPRERLPVRLRVFAIAMGAAIFSLSVQAQSAVDVVPDRPQPFSSIPQGLAASDAQKRGLESEAQLKTGLGPSFIISGGSNLPEAVAGGAEQNSSLATVQEAPWVLTPEQHPWPLNYSEPAVTNRILTSTPSVNEIRLLLPGQVLSFVERSRSSVDKFIQDSIGAATQKRRQQLEQVNSWVSRTLDQRRTLPNVVWPVYQFTLEARSKAEEFKTKVEGQSERPLGAIAAEAQRVIAELSSLMSVMPTHEMQNATYAIMVRLRDGVLMYEEQVKSADAQIIRALDAFLAQIPQMSPPTTNPPSREQTPLGGGWVEPIQSKPVAPAPVAPSTTPASPSEYRDVAPISTPLQETSQHQASGSSILGYLVLAIAGFGVFTVFSRLRRKKAGQSNAEP